jgi:hypothetical protein
MSFENKTFVPYISQIISLPNCINELTFVSLNIFKLKLYLKIYHTNVFPTPKAQQPLVGHGLLIVEASLSHSDTSLSIGFVWTSDKPDAEAST